MGYIKLENYQGILLFHGEESQSGDEMSHVHHTLILHLDSSHFTKHQQIQDNRIVIGFILGIAL